MKWTYICMSKPQKHNGEWKKLQKDTDNLCVKFIQQTCIFYGYKWNKHVKPKKRGCTSISGHWAMSGKREERMVYGRVFQLSGIFFLWIQICKK